MAILNGKIEELEVANQRLKRKLQMAEDERDAILTR